MASDNDYYILGDEINFDKINEQNLKRLYIDNNEDYSLNKDDNNQEMKIKSNIVANTSSPELNSAKESSIYRKETVQERLARLKREFKEMSTDIEMIIQKKKNIKIANCDYEEATLREIEALQNQTLELANTPGFKELANGSGNEAITLESNLSFIKSKIQSQYGESLLARIKSFQDSDEPKAINFKFFANKEQHDLKNQIKVEDIEQRLTALEKILGNSKANNILDQLEKMQRTIELINDSNVEFLGKRVVNVKHELEILNNAKQILNYTDPNMKKLEKLYESYIKVQNFSEELPAIIERLECIKAIHEESAYISDKFKGIKDLQDTLRKNLNENEELIQQVENKFVEDIPKVESKIQDLESKIMNIKTKK